MLVQYTAASPLGEAFTTKKGSILRRWLLASGVESVVVLAPAQWNPKLVKTPEGQLGVADLRGVRYESSLVVGFIRENR